MKNSREKRLEQYTLKRPQEVLLLEIQLEDETDQILIFKGFSSSLMRPTAFDPEVAVLPETAKIMTIDRLESPYNPSNPRYIQTGLTWQEMEELLSQINV
ncbi:conserved hypothetical protein [Gloeothece citriformis PCC 7424]|uniref:DUF7734 domain-containing protein n=1 Tax=Gloeothece citriformis (strain PCC 7424) TaxID=65393 RepID=B7KL76_GLOC7|nr:hypothetical protein [Gloeothece citriformis]ACK72448.1 conserved hypothetical protein [Gloeothece citriformis PCC 7424]